LEVASLVDGVHPVSEAAEVYERLRTGELKGIGFLFDYPAPDPARVAAFPHTGDSGGQAPAGITLPRRDVIPAGPRPSAPLGKERVGIGFIGAGGYASSMLLPHLAHLARRGRTSGPTAYLHRVATTRALSAANAQRAFGFAHTSTDADEVLADPEVDAVFVVTRHHSHAAFVRRALEAGKAVFVEKPLALSDEEVDGILATVAETGNDRLMVGFNRRFAPLVQRLDAGLGDGPRQVRYLVNAGALGKDSWYLDTTREGSRWAGEGGHFVDTVAALVGADPTAVTSIAHGEDRHVTLEYADGSVGQVSYLTSGSRRFPKETLDVTGAGRNARLDDFTKVTVWQGRDKDAHRSLRGQDKGQRAMLEAFLDAVRSGAPMPIPLDSLVATTRATLDADVSGRTAPRVVPTGDRP
ncbi:Gfo/Idh/MocA family protein, partial [Nocardioides sp. DS6]